MNASKDSSTSSLFELHDNLNKLLDCLDLKATTVCQKNREVDLVTPNTCVISLKPIGGSVYIAELNTADSVNRLWDYATTKWHLFETLFSEGVIIVELRSRTTL